MMKQVANEEMIRNAVGDDETEKMLIPPYTEATKDHPLWPRVQAALREVYDPEIQPSRKPVSSRCSQRRSF